MFVEETSVSTLAFLSQILGVNTACPPLPAGVQSNELVTSNTKPHCKVYGREVLVVIFEGSVWKIMVL
jgi:hypothetical protein